MLPTQSHIWEKSLVQLAAIVVAPWPLNGSFEYIKDPEGYLFEEKKRKYSIKLKFCNMLKAIKFEQFHVNHVGSIKVILH